jgi:hypothetical protein
MTDFVQDVSPIADLKYVSSPEDEISTPPFILDVGLSPQGLHGDAALAAVRPDMNGLRIRQAGGDAMYLVDRGQKRHIPNPETMNNLFNNWSHYDVLDIESIETGPPIPSGAILASPVGSGSVYLLDGGCKRHVTGPSVMKKYNFNWDRVYKLPPISLANITTGDAIY